MGRKQKSSRPNAKGRNTQEQFLPIPYAMARSPAFRSLAPETFNLLPVWYPEHARRSLFYKNNWSEPQLNTNRKTGVSIHKSEGNTNANKALTFALGLSPCKENERGQN